MQALANSLAFWVFAFYLARVHLPRPGRLIAVLDGQVRTHCLLGHAALAGASPTLFAIRWR
jgi:hypothetical protein